MKNIFKTKIKDIPTLYVVLEGHEYNLRSLIGNLEDLIHIGHWSEESWDCCDSLEKILFKREIIEKSTRGGTVCKDTKKLRNLLRKLYDTLESIEIPKREKFIKDMESNGYIRKRPTRIGSYFYTAYWDPDPSLMVIKRVDGILKVKLECQSDVYLCNVNKMPLECLWKRIDE